MRHGWCGEREESRRFDVGFLIISTIGELEQECGVSSENVLLLYAKTGRERDETTRGDCVYEVCCTLETRGRAGSVHNPNFVSFSINVNVSIKHTKRERNMRRRGLMVRERESIISGR